MTAHVRSRSFGAVLRCAKALLRMCACARWSALGSRAQYPLCMHNLSAEHKKGMVAGVPSGLHVACWYLNRLV